MSLLKGLLMSASVAAGNIASRERDRRIKLEDDDGRPRSMADRAQGRIEAIAVEGGAKLAVSQTAHLGARELARRLGEGSLKKVLTVLGKRPVAAAGSAFLVFDTARDGVRLIRGHIDGQEFAVRVGGNTAGMAGSVGGSYVGAFIGTMTVPVVGTAIGGIVGGVIGGIGGDTYGRKKVREVFGEDQWEEGEEWEDADHEGEE